MATVILNHRVSDYASWKKGFDGDKARRDVAGIKEIAVGQKAGDAGMVYLVWDVADTSVIDKMMADTELQQAMQAAGVISKPEVLIIE